MGRRSVGLILALAALAGCGGEEQASVPGALAYLPRDAYAVTLVPTDLEGEQLRRFGRLVEPTLRELGAGSLREGLDESLTGTGLSFERDIEPLLGGTLVAGASGNPATWDNETLLALETPDGERLRSLLERLGIRPGDGAAVDGDTLLVSLDGEREAIDAAIERRRAGTGIDPADVGAGEEALVRVFGDPLQARIPELRRAAELPWVRALRRYDLTLRLEDDEIQGRLRVETDPAGLRDEDLPLAAGEAAPEAGDVDGAIAAANRDQSRTTVFLAQLARLAFPDSRFVREVEALEAELGIRFEEEVLAQFDGPSASVAALDGTFAAVSDVADPDRMRALLPRLAPRLPPVLHGLQGLGSRGLFVLLLFAPDAPLVPGALPLLQGFAADVRPLPGEPGELLFEITGLDEPGPRGQAPLPGPGEVVFGMIGDRFAVATDVGRARAVARMETAPVDGARGTGLARADLSTWPADRLERLLGTRTVPLGEAVGELEASTGGVEGRLRIEVP